MKTKLFIILGITALLFTSCKDFLERNPLDQLSSETFWNTEKDAQMALAGVYQAMFNRSTFDHQQVNWDCLTEMGFQHSNHNNTKDIGQGLLTPTTGGMQSSIYSDCYRMISRCNIFLENIDNVDMSAATIAQMKSEALFLRAYAYFILTQFYGGVPLYTTPPSVEDAKVAQSTKDVVTTQILADLDAAAAGLPDVAYTDGHAVKGSAIAMKAKVLMHNQRWSEAVTAANQLIGGPNFSLYTGNYEQMFLTVGQENNPEIIFSARYRNPDLNASWGPDIIRGWWNSPVIHHEFPDTYECIDGLPIDQSPLYTGDPTDKTNRDPRYDYNVRWSWEPIVRSDGYEWSDWTTGAITANPMMKKYVNPESVPIDYSNKCDADWIILRYAEVLLIYAECQNEASGPNQSVHDAVNAVRDRVGMPDLPAGLDQAGMRDAIRHERAVELTAEGARYLDLKRWGTAHIVIPTIIDEGGFPRTFSNPKHYLFPFPQSEMDINDKLIQNPGY